MNKHEVTGVICCRASSLLLSSRGCGGWNQKLHYETVV